MSTLQCGNIHFESTGNNRIQYYGSNTFAFVASGANLMVVNTSVVSINGSQNYTINSLSVSTNVATIGTGSYFVANGNFGIGTSSPATTLHVVSGSTPAIFQSNSLTGATVVYFKNANSNPNLGYIGYGSGSNEILNLVNLKNDAVSIYANGMLNGFFAANGNFGLSTATPKARLHVTSSGATINNTLGNINPNNSLYVTNSDDNYGLVISSDGSGKSYIQSQRTDGTATAYDILLNPLGGRVLLGGLTGPYGSSGEVLSVNGMITAISNTHSNQNSTLYLYNTNRVASNNQPYITFHDGDSVRSRMGVNYTDGALWIQGAFGTYFRNNTSEVGRFDVNGNFNVGSLDGGGKGGSYDTIIAAEGNDSALVLKSTYGSSSTWAVQSYNGYMAFLNGAGNTSRWKIDDVGRVTQPYQPGFRVYGPSAAAGADMTFGSVDSAFSSRYSGWNSSTNTFTAPVAGMYMFTFSFLHNTTGASYARVGFKINGGLSYAWGDTLNDGYGSYGHTGMAMAFQLNAGDSVKLYNEGAAIYGTGYGSFSGFLIG